MPAFDSSSSAASGMTLASLQGLPLRLIALKLSNPGPLSQSCSAAYNAIHRDEAQMDFELEWFLRWVHVLAPLRPWQFAAVGWQRLGGQHATAEQLSSFILRLCAAKRQQQLLLHTGSSGMRPRNKPGQPTWAQQQWPEPSEQQVQLMQQQVQQQLQQLLQQMNLEMPPEQLAAATTVSPQNMQPPRPRFTPIPQCLPLLSVQQQAQKFLDQGHAVRALRLLCDGPPWLLYQYAAAAGNLQLLQLLITERNWAQVPHPYHSWDFPTTAINTSEGGGRLMNTAQLCAYAALCKGHVHVLREVLLRAGSSIKGPPAPHQVGQLLRCAVRHSNAACLQTLLDFAYSDDTGCRWLVVWPQHLVMAASRADPWAGGVSGLLLRIIEPKLLAAKYMRPVYLAACRTGHTPVLQQLVQQAVQRSAAGCDDHLYYLLSAAAEAGNLRVWRALLGLDLLEQLLDGAAGHDSSGSMGSGSSGSARLDSTTSNSSTAGAAGRDSDAQQTAGCDAAGQLPAKVGCLLFSHQHHVQQQERLTKPSTAAAHDSCSRPQLLSDFQQGSQVLALPADLIVSALQDPADMLQQVLQRMNLTQPQAVSSEKLRLRADADRAAMADAFMQWLLQVSPGPAFRAHNFEGQPLDSIRAGMRARFCQDAFPWAPGSLGGLQQLLAGPFASAAQLVWLLQQDMLPVPPTGWQPAPAVGRNLTTCICFCLKSGQREAAHTLWRFARQLQLQITGEQLAQAAFDGAVCAAAAAQDEAAVQQLQTFAEQYRLIAKSARSAIAKHMEARVMATDQLMEVPGVEALDVTQLQQDLEAAGLAGQQGDSRVQSAAHIVSAHAAAAVGLLAAEAEPTGRRFQSLQEHSIHIMPLWQRAAVALAAQHIVSDLFDFKVDAHAALAAVLEPVIFGHAPTDASSVKRAAAAAATEAAPAAAPAAATAAAATPVFLKGAAVGTSSMFASPPPPPEHPGLAVVLRHLMRSAPLLKSPVPWPGLWGWPRPDAVAWMLHSDQQHLHASPAARSAAIVSVARMVDQLPPPVQETLAEELQEQQLRWHRGLQSQQLSVTEGFGALPRHATAAADTVTLLLGLGYPVDANHLVKHLTGASGPATVEGVKAMLAALLAGPSKDLRGSGLKLAPSMPTERREVFESDRWLRMSPTAVRKAVDVGDMDLITLLILCNQRMYNMSQIHSWL